VAIITGLLYVSCLEAGALWEGEPGVGLHSVSAVETGIAAVYFD